MRRLPLLFLLLLLPALAQAQYIMLTRAGQPHTLYLSLDKILNYNLYEQTRLGLGLYYVGKVGGKLDSKISASGYGAFGIADHRFKYGASAQYQFAGKPHFAFQVRYSNDLEHAASRRLENFQLSKIAETGEFMTQRYLSARRVSAGVSAYASKEVFLSLTYRHSAEQYLFNATTPKIYAYRGDTPMPEQRFNELDLKFSLLAHLKMDLLVGLQQSNQALEWSYLRVLAQYKRSLVAKKKFPPTLWVDVYGQVGANAGITPYSRMFDLSGSYGSYFFFDDALLTVPYNTFVANLFAQAQVRLNLGKPLWKARWSTPRPFFQLAALWGTLYDADGNLCGATDCDLIAQPSIEIAAVNALPLQAPSQGLLEPAIGINELLKWRVFNLGLATAYQLTLPNAPYHNDDPLKNLAFTVTAHFTL